MIKMKDLCRFCFSIHLSNLHNLSRDHGIVHKIETCFSIKIEHNPLLPNQVCSECLNKINEASEFKTKVIENESLLQEHVKNEKDISNLYTKIKDKFNVKEESINLGYEEKCSIDNLETKNEVIKHEFEDVVEESYTSDDEVLSKLKENKKEVKIEDRTLSVSETHKCLTCFQILDTQIDLLKHYKLVHFDLKDSKKDMIKDYTTEASESSVIYKCNVCSKEYRSKKNIHRHLAGHSDQRPYLCRICGRTYKTASEIIRHGRVHSDTKLFCMYQCGYSTVYLGALRSHEKRHGKAEYKYKCEKCSKGFEVKTWYEQHQNIHTGIKPFVCDICGMAFHMDRFLTAHRSSMHPQMSDLKRYICVHCSLPCDSKNALNKHLEVHGIKTSFLCDLCGKTLSNSRQLMFHKKTHLGEKPFTCSTCNKSFTKKFNLKVHQRTHTGERTNACVRCGRRYTQRSTLLRHYARHHPGIELMDCNTCQKSFPSTKLLKIHQKNCKCTDIPDLNSKTD